MDENNTSSEEESEDESEVEDDEKNVRERRRSTRDVRQDYDKYCLKAQVGSTLRFMDVEDH